MTVSTRSFGQITASFQAAAQNAAAAIGRVLSFSVGSVPLALAEASGAVALWLQKIALQVMALTRFATSYGADADSWGAQFQFPRLPAVAATGPVVFATSAPATSQILIPATASLATTTQFQTADGTETFGVTIDTGNPAWNATLGGYVLSIGQTMVTVPAQALATGPGGNVVAATVFSPITPVPGIASITAGATFVGGINAEPDPNYKARFPLYIAGLASADLAAIESAIADVQQGLTYKVVENLDYPGTTVDNGSFFVLVNDGSGSPPSTLLAAVTTAVDAVRAFTVRFQGAFAATLTAPAIILVVRVAPGFIATQVFGAVQTAVAAAVNMTPLGQGVLFVSQIEQAALGVPGVVAVEPGATLINGVDLDLVLANVSTLPQITVSNVSVSQY